MLALRLALGTHPLVQLRRLMVAAASAGVGFLLLCTLTYALAHPTDSGASTLRLLWCAIPLATTVYFAVAVARTDPSTRPRTGLSAVGLGPARMAVLAASSTAVSGTLGSMVALLFFLHLRGDLTGFPFDGAAAGLLAAEQQLPLAGLLTLLALTPLAATTAVAVAMRPHREPQQPSAPSAEPSGLPWGVALMAAGLAAETYASSGPVDSPLSVPTGVLVSGALTTVGLALAGPAITHLCGRLLQAFRPGPTRLLAGRALMEESRRIGRPLGVLCAVASALLTASMLSTATSQRPLGPLTGLGATLVIACTTATLLTAVLESKHARAATTEELLRLGTPSSMLHNAMALRMTTLLLVFAPLTWAISTLAAIPLTR
ncbi:hypothetical protein AB0M39_17395 [Streptomyces sp. NPDC051907]|uniref:hypothetical protein n=1 Tax=Streptomyces sp. NPDC051907 TaxID=3155284 RepID=UPI00344A2510